jgi:2-iminoacetate synthase
LPHPARPVTSAAVSFADEFDALPWSALQARALGASGREVDSILRHGPKSLTDFAALLSPAAGERLETLCRQSQHMTRQRFGRTIRLFAPLYLSNECINNCAYCGFSRDNAILRVTLSVEEVVREARALADQGFRNLLLVAGEHPRFISNGYMAQCVEALHAFIPSLSLEVGPMETPDYRPLVAAGAEGLVVYQETYDREVYGRMHTLGPKRDFNWRLDTPERAYAAGFRRLGIGALYGLSDWRLESLRVAAHAAHLLRHCWKALLTVSLPRLRPCAGEFDPLTDFQDRALVQAIAALRLFLPDVGLVLSTREPAGLRDGLLPLGITHASAGSHTEPGGYTGAGREKIHLTVRGRIQELAAGSSEWAPQPGRSTNATGQFAIDLIRRLGYEPVWKDWDAALTA